jgi:hypothetical protein
VPGSSLVLPPGWRRVPLVRGSDGAVERLVADAFAGRPPDEHTALRHQLRGLLRAQVADARRRGGVDLYLPAGGHRGLPVAASFVVAVVPSPAGRAGPAGSPGTGAGAGGAEDLLAALLVRAGTDLVTLPAGAAARWEHVRPAGTGRERAPGDDLPDVGHRQVDYALPVPGSGDTVVVTFATPGAGDPGDELAGLLVELFDACMTTFRWTGAHRTPGVFA